jgi:selenocysteine lyase/cysteine desulfurase
VNDLAWAYLAEFSEPDGYLDFAGIGPVSRRVEEALNSETAAIRDAAEPLGSRFERTIGEAIAGAARLLGVPPDNVGIVASTGVGIFHVAFGISGGNVVVPAGEFPANLYPWFRAQQAGIIDEVRSVPVPDGRLVADVLRPYVDSDTSAVALSSVDYLTGFRADLEAMREFAEDALLVVDAIQGFGAFPLTLEPADVVIAGGQKWLRGGMGAAVMAVSSRAMERLEPTLSGWLAVAEPFGFELLVPQPVHASALRYQMSAPPLPAAAGLTAAFEVLDLAGIDAISEAVLARSAAVEEAGRRSGAEVLTPWRSDSERSGVVSLRMPGEMPEATLARLASAGYTASVRRGWLRLSPHATTPLATIEYLARVLAG